MIDSRSGEREREKGEEGGRLMGSGKEAWFSDMKRIEWRVETMI